MSYLLYNKCNCLHLIRQSANCVCNLPIEDIKTLRSQCLTGQYFDHTSCTCFHHLSLNKLMNIKNEIDLLFTGNRNNYCSKEEYIEKFMIYRRYKDNSFTKNK